MHITFLNQRTLLGNGNIPANTEHLRALIMRFQRKLYGLLIEWNLKTGKRDSCVRMAFARPLT